MAQCLFCANKAATKEHVWPNWLVNYFASKAPRKAKGRSGAIYRGTMSRDRQVVRAWDSNSIEHTSRIVCAKCNNNWMSELETVAKPVLLPLISDPLAPRVLSLDEQCKIAVWATLRSMVFDASGPSGTPRYYQDSDCARFADPEAALEPPPDTHVWLAAYITDERRSARIDVVNEHRSNGDFHVATWLMDALAVQFVTRRGDGRRINHELLNRHRWTNATTKVWPSRSRGVAWPPPLLLGDEGLQSFHDRFRPTRE